MIKKFITVVASVAMVMSSSIMAFAASPEGGVQTTGGDLNISKTIVVSNPTLTSVDGPGLKYDYTITIETPSASNGGTTKDGVTVKAGVSGGATLSTSSVEWPKGTAVTASASGAENTKNITVTTDATKFTAPGIYRYKITEASTPTDPSTIGVTDANAAEVRYLDVYVENGANGFTVTGYVLHDGDNNKGTFDNSTYETKNVEVKKSITGSMADKNHEFPFTIAVSDNGRSYYEGKGSAATAATTANTTGSSSTSLKDNESFWICGVSKTATVTVTETNDTADTYKTTVSGLATVAETEVAANGTAATSATTVNNGGQILYTNNFDSVSPTGIVMRFGPYIGLVLVAGLLIFMRKRTAKDTE